uniref:Transient receptor ion channel domain-containing protein n=1 Tax=Anopheles maculatus TaxID=74869 RepID=A0A182T089_9DIPT
MASPSLVALSSKDPILTAFELSWELRRLSFLEHEFKNEYQELRRQCQDFATALLDHTRSSHELEVLLNHDPTGPAFEHGDRMHLNRLKLAVKLRQKKVRKRKSTIPKKKKNKTVDILASPTSFTSA